MVYRLCKQHPGFLGVSVGDMAPIAREAISGVRRGVNKFLAWVKETKGTIREDALIGAQRGGV